MIPKFTFCVNSGARSLYYTKCDREFCDKFVASFPFLRPNLEVPETCAVCLEDLEGRELALLLGCNHILCADCNRMYRKSNDSRRFPHFINLWVHECPLCRKYSRAAIYANHSLPDLIYVYDNHLKCLGKVSYIAQLRDSINNPIWLDLLNSMLFQRPNFKYPIRLNNVEFDKSCITITMFEPNYVVYVSKLDKSRRSFRLITFWTFDGISVQLMFSSEPLSYDTSFYDNEYADKFATMLNQDSLRFVQTLHPEFNRFLMWRKLDNFHCALKVDKILKESPVQPPEGNIFDQFELLQPHNFCGELVKSLSDDIVDEKDLKDYFDGDIRHNIARFMFPKIAVDIEVREIHLSNKHPNSPVV